MPKTLFDDVEYTLPNVAKVPLYSPFRYPGGKSRWYFYIKQWILSTQPSVFVEPFAGGAHAGLAVAIEPWAHTIVDEVILVEVDENVSAVWKTIFSDEVDWLLDRIQSFEMSRAAAEGAIEAKDQSVRDRAFAMIVHNRVSRGGITAPGAGWVKKGENGKGLSSRWYAKTLVQRIQKIADFRSRVTFVEGDAFNVFPDHVGAQEALFIDPPYPKAGGRLYEHSDVDHDEIFRYAASAEGTVLLTYDNSEHVQALVNAHGFDSEELIVSTTHHTRKTELLIGKDLTWLRSMDPSM
ncbi:DNA methyltransferase [Longimonas halophila]|uniref:DNA methyltransferase n=1 Tax=Longimonas halophila TaxID=1469170 RepID=A0A2H3NT20_9BACT|nr:DNA adenine methylase [Longimonas halophila]PEN06977.1 DNA methyltransferase [Longimonas halophila]